MYANLARAYSARGAKDLSGPECVAQSASFPAGVPVPNGLGQSIATISKKSDASTGSDRVNLSTRLLECPVFGCRARQDDNAGIRVTPVKHPDRSQSLRVRYVCEMHENHRIGRMRREYYAPLPDILTHDFVSLRP